MVRWEDALSVTPCSQRETFNSTMVRWEAGLYSRTRSSLTTFNSTMVRWEGRMVCSVRDQRARFQFHYGAMGGSAYSPLPRSPSLLSIPLWCDGRLNIKVFYTDVKGFQFHYGAMGGIQLPITITSKSPFQFHYGAMGGGRTRGSTIRPTQLSIPLWCDGSLSCSRTSPRLTTFQFHYGAMGGPESCFGYVRDATFQFHYGAMGGGLSRG